MTARAIPLEGCLNFRDLGGYPTAEGRTVRWRQVFRSDALHLLTPADIAVAEPIEDSKGRIALNPYQPAAQRVYPIGALP